MQGVTEAVVKAIEGIGKTITEVNEIATVIASAVEEQGAATQEIARNVQEAAKGTQEVNREHLRSHHRRRRDWSRGEPDADECRGAGRRVGQAASGGGQVPGGYQGGVDSPLGRTR